MSDTKNSSKLSTSPTDYKDRLKKPAPIIELPIALREYQNKMAELYKAIQDNEAAFGNPFFVPETKAEKSAREDIEDFVKDEDG